MKIAVTYDNGNVWQHFGHTETFKVYNVEDNKVVSSEILSADGNGHEALAQVLVDADVDVLICGGIGNGAMDALDYAGIEVCSGAQGNADEAVEAYLRSELLDAGVNCDHHEREAEEEAGCGSESGCGSCGGGCGGCGGGCGGRRVPQFEGKNVGKTVKVHYKGTFNDGSQFDSSYDRGEPLEFVCGAGMMILGFDKACAELNVGDIVDIHLMPNEAYGEKDPNAVVTIEIAFLEGAAELNVGEKVLLYNNMGQPVPVTVVAKDEKNISFDTNHEMAGQELNFRIEMVSIED